MRRAAKVDANQARIVMALRQAGVAVEPLHAVGGGVPDLLCASPRIGNLLIEVKDGDKPPSARKLTPAQEEWHARWPGPIAVVSTVQEALEAVGVEVRGQIGDWKSIGALAEADVRRLTDD